jgi:hypothetical protein
MHCAAREGVVVTAATTECRIHTERPLDQPRSSKNGRSLPETM